MQIQSARKILIASEYFYPHWTGIAQSVYYMALDLLNQGHSVEVLTTQHDRTLPTTQTHQGIPITRSPYLFKMSRTHYSLALIFQYVQMLPRFDTVIINSPNSNILFLSLACKLMRKKLVLYHQGDITLPRQTGNRIKHILIERLFDACTLPAVRMADMISCCTRDYIQHSRVFHYHTCPFEPYIADIQLSNKPPHQEFAIQLARLKKNHVLLGIAGRFVEEKGFDILFQALPHILQSVPKAHIVFAGKKDMDYEPFFEKNRELFDAYADSITYLGLLTDGDYAHFFECLDIFVLPSRSDCFPATQIEATIKSVPIVVTDIPGARELVKQTGAGVIVKKLDPIDLARGINTVTQHPHLYSKHSHAAVQWLRKFKHVILPPL